MHSVRRGVHKTSSVAAAVVFNFHNILLSYIVYFNESKKIYFIL